MPQAATDDVQQLKQMIAEAQAEAKDLESQCEIALPPKRLACNEGGLSHSELGV